MEWELVCLLHRENLSFEFCGPSVLMHIRYFLGWKVERTDLQSKHSDQFAPDGFGSLLSFDVIMGCIKIR